MLDLRPSLLEDVHDVQVDLLHFAQRHPMLGANWVGKYPRHGERFNMPGTPNPSGTSGLISTQSSYNAPRTLQLTGRVTF
jgi:hypothetical protein